MEYGQHSKCVKVFSNRIIIPKAMREWLGLQSTDVVMLSISSKEKKPCITLSKEPTNGEEDTCTDKGADVYEF